jgi:hypothetical protein
MTPMNAMATLQCAADEMHGKLPSGDRLLVLGLKLMRDAWHDGVMENSRAPRDGLPIAARFTADDALDGGVPRGVIVGFAETRTDTGADGADPQRRVDPNSAATIRIYVRNSPRVRRTGAV